MSNQQRPWREALVWLGGLGVFFFASYGWANAFTAGRPGVGSVVCAWERHIPFLPWTIVPYWSIDLAYAASLLLCANPRELRLHGARLALASVVSVSGFLLFPLRFSFTRPPVEGLPGALFNFLGAFDKPFNQAPSLHIALLVILWTFYAAKVPPRGRAILHGWAALVGLSVLTTWQHHFVDVVTGAFAGILCLCAIPSTFRFQRPDAAGIAIGLRYLGGGLLMLVPAGALGGWAWLLAWPALSLGLVAAGYLGLGPGVFGPASAPWYWRVLMLPVRLGATVSARLLSRHREPFTELAPGLWVGRTPAAGEAARLGVRTLVDLSPELLAAPVEPGIRRVSAPLLDLATPTEAEWSRAVEAAGSAWAEGPVLIHCALGLQRSVLVACALQVRKGQDPETAWAQARALRPGACAKPGQLARLGLEGTR